MPTSFLSADAGFPRLTADVPVEERMRRITDYLYMLLENLRYTLGNLGEENFNEASLASIERAITDPIMQVVTDVQGNVSTLEQTATAITARLDNVDGDHTSIEVFAGGIKTRLDDFAGNNLTIEAYATGITTRLDDFNGSGSSIEQTARGIIHEVYDNDGAVSIAQQTADKISWIVDDSDPTSTSTTFTLTSHMASLVADEINVQGVVTFTSLDAYLARSGSTQINGNNVLLKTDGTGVSDSFLGLMNNQGNAYGSFRTQDTSYSTNPYDDARMVVLDAFGLADNEYVGLRLSSGRSLVIEAANTVNLLGNQIVMNTSGQHPVIIQADNAPYSSAWCPWGCYSFCDDGIYYGSTKIVAV